jgi:hypothetical protein
MMKYFRTKQVFILKLLTNNKKTNKKMNIQIKEETKANTSTKPTWVKAIKYTSNQCKGLQHTSTMTLTYGDVAENHRGMEKIGNLAKEGFNIGELEEAKRKFEAKGCKCELIDLNKAIEGTEYEGESAAILIVRKGIDFLHDGLSADKLFEEQMNLNWDTKAKMYGRVVEKHARSNLCYAEKRQEPEYAEGKGRVVHFDDIPMTKAVREHLGEFLGEKGVNLMAEGNLYHNLSKCGIGFHGDTERRIVVGLRLGATMNLQYQWFIEGRPIGKRVEVYMNHGDLYVMSQKASGFDWKTKKKATLRHAAGGPKYTTIKAKAKKVGEKKRKSKKEESESSEGDSESSEGESESEDEKVPKIGRESKKIKK